MNKMNIPIVFMAVSLAFSQGLPGQVNKNGGDWEVEGLYNAVGVNPPTDSRFFPVIVVGDLNQDGFSEFALLAEMGLAMFSGIDGNNLWSHSYSISIGSTEWPRWIKLIHDFDGDGQRDLLVGIPDYSSNRGIALVHSSADGSVLWSADGSQYGINFGATGSPVRDINFDGIDDFVVAGLGPFPNNSQVDSSLNFFSGADGSLIRSVVEINSNRYFTYVASDGDGLDLDFDGVGDVLAQSYANEIYAVSGRDGSTIYTFPGSRIRGFANQPTMALISDVDGDGVRDFVIPLAYKSNSTGGFTCRSGVNGTEIWRAVGNNLNTYFGETVSAIEDFNADGIRDLLVTERGKKIGREYAGIIHLVDGATGNTYRKIKPSEWNLPKHEGFGYSIDYDLATGTLLVREMVEISYRNDATMVYKFHPYLSSLVKTISSSLGGTFPMEIDFPSEAANLSYALLLSRHGYGPVLLGGVKVPLSWDGLLADSLQGALPGYFGNGQGVLNATGDGSIQVSIPRNALGSMIGQTVTASVVALGPSNTIEYVSVAVATLVEP
jgi:hypothetical protein